MDAGGFVVFGRLMNSLRVRVPDQRTHDAVKSAANGLGNHIRAATDDRRRLMAPVEDVLVNGFTDAERDRVVLAVTNAGGEVRTP